MSNTLGQQRATFALQALKAKLGKDVGKMDLHKEFPPLAAGLPAMILQNGFGQTLAFLLAKAGDEKDKKKDKKNDKHYVAYSIIRDWLAQNSYLDKGDDYDVIRQISNMDQIDFLQAQRETLAMLEWLKRFANAALFKGGSDAASE